LSALLWIVAAWFVVGWITFAVVRPLLVAGKKADEAYERQMEAAGLVPQGPEADASSSDRLFARRAAEAEAEHAGDRV
jgi:hypothetical protein